MADVETQLQLCLWTPGMVDYTGFTGFVLSTFFVIFGRYLEACRWSR